MATQIASVTADLSEVYIGQEKAFLDHAKSFHVLRTAMVIQIASVMLGLLDQSPGISMPKDGLVNVKRLCARFTVQAILHASVIEGMLAAFGGAEMGLQENAQLSSVHLTATISPIVSVGMDLKERLTGYQTIGKETVQFHRDRSVSHHLQPRHLLSFKIYSPLQQHPHLRHLLRTIS